MSTERDHLAALIVSLLVEHSRGSGYGHAAHLLRQQHRYTDASKMHDAQIDTASSLAQIMTELSEVLFGDEFALARQWREWLIVEPHKAFQAAAGQAVAR